GTLDGARRGPGSRGGARRVPERVLPALPRDARAARGGPPRDPVPRAALPRVRVVVRRGAALGAGLRVRGVAEEGGRALRGAPEDAGRRRERDRGSGAARRPRRGRALGGDATR